LDKYWTERIMARTVRDANLEHRTARGRLKSGGKPYFRAIDQGLHLGYRKGQGGGKWVMRWYLGNQEYRVATIGMADDTLDPDGNAILSFSQAQAVARERFVEIKRTTAGLSPKAGPYTVRLCLDEYISWLKQNRKTARDASWRAEALILPRLGDMDCATLTTKTLRDWRDAVANAPPRRRTRKDQTQQFREAGDEDPEEAVRRRHASANRVLSILKAALNHAWREKKISSDEAWRALKPFKGADAARIRYLTIEEANHLINAAEPDFRILVQVALLTGARYSELGALVVGDFNPDSGTLHIRTGKSGKGRHVVLTEEGIAFVKGLCAGRSNRDRLLSKKNGGRWLKSHQIRPMRYACEHGQIDPPVGFHALRHTYASLSVMNGAPLLVVARNLGHTNTRMTEQHYGHLSASYLAEAIRAAAPRFGIGGNAAPIPTTDGL
jgi:integrase